MMDFAELFVLPDLLWCSYQIRTQETHEHQSSLCYAGLAADDQMSHLILELSARKFVRFQALISKAG